MKVVGTKLCASNAKKSRFIGKLSGLTTFAVRVSAEEVAMIFPIQKSRMIGRV